MIGEDYLNLRARLGTALFSLQTLAGELRASAEVMGTLQELQKSLREPFLFVVVGDAKAGKSTLLNSIFDREFCQPLAPSEPGRILLFKYGEEERDLAVGEDLMECNRNAGFLRDFNIVEIPGVNHFTARHDIVTSHFIPHADLVLFVFSAVNPWSASAWSFLRLINQRWLKNVALVIQQSELRNADELASITAYLRKTLRERVGHQCPVFTVSARRALEARLNGENISDQSAATGMDRLEQFINVEVVSSQARLDNLRRVCQQALQVLSGFESHARKSTTAIEREKNAIREIEHELADSKEQALRQIGGVLWSMAQSYDKAQKRSEELFLERLTLLNSFRLLFRSGKWQRELHGKIEERLRGGIQLQSENAVQTLDADLRHVWTQLEQSLRRAFQNSLLPVQLPEFQSLQSELMNRIEQTLLDCARHQQLGDQVEKRFAETARWLRFPAVFALIGGLATAAVAILRPEQIQFTIIAAGSLVFVSLCLALFKRRRILADLRQQMFRNREATLSGIEDHLRRAVENFFDTLTPILAPLHNVRPTAAETSTSLGQRLEQLREIFAKSATELGVSTSAEEQLLAP
jgi:predicted GTPase